MLNTKLLAQLRSVLKEKPAKALHEPYFDDLEIQRVTECIKTGWVSYLGPAVQEFEQQLSRFTGAQSAISMVNGTAALHLCLKLVGVQVGEEVFVPSFTFIASVNSIAYCGAMPHFIASTENTLGIDVEALRLYWDSILEVKEEGTFNRLTKKRVRALVAVHIFGHPLDLDALNHLCQDFNIVLVEDAAESLGSFYKGSHTGNIGRIAALSFNGNKVVTTGGGGAILTNDPVLAERAKHLSTTARTQHALEFSHDEIGYNYRLPNVNAAIGCAQLEKLPYFLESKRRLAEAYHQAVIGAHYRTIREPKHCQSNYWLNAILFESPDLARSALIDLNEAGIGVRPAWKCMHLLPMYQHCPRMALEETERLVQSLVNIPSSVILGE